MTVTPSKQEKYESLIAKMKSAYDDEYYLETSWIAYAILEDRLLSALSQSGGIPKRRHKPIRMLGPKVDEIDKRRKKDKLLNAYFTDDLMSRIKDWKEQRDSLMHSMADGSESIESLNKASCLLAQRAIPLIKLVCAAARTLKNNRSRVPIPG